MYFTNENDKTFVTLYYIFVMICTFHLMFFFLFPDMLNRSIYWLCMDLLSYYYDSYLGVFFNQPFSYNSDLYWQDLWYTHI